MRFGFHTADDLAQKPAAAVFFNDRDSFPQHFIADIGELVARFAGRKPENADHCSRSVLAEHTDRKESCLFDAGMTVIFRGSC